MGGRGVSVDALGWMERDESAGAGKAAEGGGGDGLVKEDDAPEDEAIAALGGLVAEMALGEEGSGPAAGEFAAVQGPFGDAAASDSRLSLVEGVEGPGEESHKGAPGCHPTGRLGPLSQGQDGKDEQDSQEGQFPGPDAGQRP